jgi:thioredoxin 1
MDLSAENFAKEVLESKTPVLVDFYSNWCPPCKMLEPIFAELARELEGKIKFGRLNTDGNRELAIRYGIRGIPTLILFKDGREEKRIVGLRSKEELKRELT